MVESALPVTASNVERAITSDLPQNQVKVRFLCMRDILCDTVDRHIVFRLVCQIPSLLVLHILHGEGAFRRDEKHIRTQRQVRNQKDQAEENQERNADVFRDDVFAT